jgi:hypothetical protein
MPDPAPITSLTPAPTQTITAPTPLPGVVYTVPSVDLLDGLPPPAAERLQLLRQRSIDSHAVVPQFEQIHEASMEKINAEREVTRLTNHPQDFGLNLKPDNRTVIAAQKRLDKATADFERLKQLQEIRIAAWQSASGALANAESWLRDGRPQGVVMHDHETEMPPLQKGESVLDGVERHRRRIRELRADLHRVASAQFPSNYTKAQMRRQFALLAERGAPDVTPLVELDGKVAFPMMRLQATVIGSTERSLAFTETVDAAALTVWLHHDALVKRLDAEIDSESDDKNALTPEQREIRTSEIMNDILATERAESALVWTAQSQNLPCEHRSDINPIALLSLRLETVTNGHDATSSPLHAYDISYGGR